MPLEVGSEVRAFCWAGHLACPLPVHAPPPARGAAAWRGGGSAAITPHHSSPQAPLLPTQGCQFNYVVSAHKPTAVNHSAVGHFTSATDLNLVVS